MYCISIWFPTGVIDDCRKYLKAIGKAIGTSILPLSSVGPKTVLFC